MNLRLARFAILWVSCILYFKSVQAFAGSKEEKTAITISESISEITCLGNSDGAIDITISGGIGPFIYSWSNGENTQDVSGLAPGDYTVTVTDTGDGNTTKTETFTIDPGFYVLEGANNNSKSVGCTYDSDGTLNIVITAGHGPYTYEWYDSEGNLVGNNSNVSGITAGEYTLVASGFSNDDNQCFVTETIIVSEPAPVFTVSADITPVGCNGDSDGEIDLTVTSPNNGAIKYDWITTGENVEDITVLTAGDYVVKISQGGHCEIHTFTVTQPDAIILTPVPTNLLCNGDASGAIDLSVTGGTGPYTYLWNTGSTSQDLAGLASGTYSVTVTDNNGCSANTSVTINEPSVLSLTTTSVNVDCNGNSTGSINLSVAGGTGAYSYLWSNSQTTEDLSNLAAGTYSVTVTDGNNCTVTTSVNITQPAVLTLSASSVDVDCNGSATGSIDLSVTGGTGPYTYAWSNTSTAQDIGSLLAGNYSVTVTDGRGCTASTSVTINQPTALSLSTSQVNILCNGAATGSIDLSVSGGTVGYSYLWSNGATTQDISGLAAGNYSVTVTDANGCTETTSVTITQPSAIALSTSQVNVTCKGDSDGSIDLTVSGGTGAYTYSWSNGPTTQDINALAAGAYTVTATDASGCTASTTVNITEPPTALTASYTQQNVSCNGGNDASINLTIANEAAPVSYLWSNGATSEDLTNIAAGTYSVTVTDALGCITVSNIVITEPAVLTASATKVDVDCNGNITGSVDLTVTGGTTPYTYSWNAGLFNTQDINGLPAGNYSVVVTDALGCTANAAVTITEPAVLSLNTAKVDVTCNGGNNGSIDLTVSGGTGPYSYNWDSGQTTEDLNTLSAGTYNITVTDARGCTETASVTIIQPSAIIITEVVTDAGCAGGAAGVIDITVAGGAGGYTFLWSNGATTEDIAGLPFGNYTVTVTDANHCTAQKTIVVNEDVNVSLTATVQNVSCNGGNDGKIDLNISGAAPFNISWDDFSIDEDRSGLSAGDYVVTVIDNNNCSTTLSVTITEPAPLSLTTSPPVNVLCNGNSTGSIDLSVSGGTAPYFYNWNTGAFNTQDLSNIPAGVYSVVVTDSKGCTANTSVTITEPAAIVLSTTPANVKCNGGNDGSINLTVSGGTGGYTYSWSNGATSKDISSLVAGNYTVIVTDASGCTANTLVTINEPAVLALSTTSVNVDCNGNSTGSINLTVAGGAGGYTYLWSNGQTTEDLSNLPIGTYSVTVTDANNCTATTSVTITQPAVLALSASPVDVTCNGDATGSIDLSVTGGTGPYSYAWSNTATTQDIGGLLAGNYSVTVTDARGCTTSTSVTINQPTALNLSTSQVNVLCNGAATGSIDLSVSGGTVGYSYLWSNGATTQDLSNLVAGSYSVTVTDGNGCTATTSVNITQPLPITLSTSKVDITCKGDSDGSIDLTVSGGTGAYTYSWSNGPTTQDINTLAAGAYTVTVTDASGCNASTTVNITEPPTALTATYTQQNVSCNGGNDASIDLSIANGVAPVSYLWSNGATSEDLTSITAGTYSVTVTDALGCITIRDIIITQPTVLTASATKIDIDCNGNSSGSIDLTVAGGTAPYTYVWSNSSTNQDLSNIPAGVYSVTVTDALGCTANLSSTLIEPNAIVLTQDVTNVSCNGGSDGSIDITIAGGKAPYLYSWNSGSTSQDLEDISAGTYIVTATDANGCTETLTVQVTEPGTELSATVSVTDINCKGQNTGAIDLTVSGGTAPYTYEWNYGATTEDVSSLPAGSYSVTIRDSNNCLTLNGITISEPAAVLTATSIQQNVSCNGGNDGSINLTVSGGTAPYSYLWSNGSTNQDLNNLTAGNYSVTITDSKGCVKNSAFTISEPDAINIALSKTDVNCFGTNDGQIDATITGGTAPYSYSWNNRTSTEDLTNVVFGNYTLTVTDANGCSSSASISIVEPAALSLSSTITDAGCNGGTNGAIDLAVSGGTSPYTFSWSNGATTEDLSNLGFGTYTVTVTDASGCSADLAVSVSEDASFDLSLTATAVSCNGGTDGAVDLQITGGQAPFNYTWSNGAITEDISNVPAGTYSVTVVDANGCTYISQIEITEPDPISVQVSSTDILCNGSRDGSFTLSLIGGTAPYGINVSVVPGTGIQATVTDSNGCTPVVFGIESNVIGFPFTASASITGSELVVGNLGAGTYNITRPDLGGSVIATATVNEPAAISISGSTTHVSCNGGTNGAIDLTVSGGKGSYSYSWSNGKSVADLSNLASGTYTVMVTDANGCRSNASFTISEPGPIAISAGIQDVLCYGGTNGRINLSVSGGTGPYTYNWSNGSTSRMLNNISAGNYSVLVTDANGCTAEESFVVDQPTQIMIDVTAVNLSCYQAGDGAIDISVSGGGGAYTYFWSNGATTEDISGLSAGMYSLLITDANGCTAQKSILITEPQQLVLAASINQIECFGANNGDIDLTVSGGTAPFTFTWSNGASTEDISNLIPGDYSITVTDANGCTISQLFQITQPNEITVSVAQQNILCNGENTGSITLTVAGGVGSYQIDWLDGARGANRTDLLAGTYEATVIDGNGCPLQVSVTLTEPDPIIIEPTITHISCNGDATGAVSLNVLGGVGPYTYSWSNGATTPDIDQLTAGIYEVTVVDSNNCSLLQTVLVEEPEMLTGSVSQTLNIDCDMRIISETITASIQGGTAPYTYSWEGNPFGASDNITLYQDGTYQVTVRDANNCEMQLNFTVTLPLLGESDLIVRGIQDPQNEYIFNTPILFEVEKTDNITFWEWDLGDGNTSTEESFEHTYADVGQYVVRLTTTDANGCTQEHEINITIDLGYEIVMPTAFTPNSDGLNDKLYPEFYGIDELKLIIYNTWGEVIFVSESMESGGWNGQIKNEEAPAGGYAYKLMATSISGISIEKTGSFLLVKK